MHNPAALDRMFIVELMALELNQEHLWPTSILRAF